MPQKDVTESTIPSVGCSAIRNRQNEAEGGLPTPAFDAALDRAELSVREDARILVLNLQEKTLGRAVGP